MRHIRRRCNDFQTTRRDVGNWLGVAGGETIDICAHREQHGGRGDDGSQER
jgi:hypothetical protein